MLRSAETLVIDLGPRHATAYMFRAEESREAYEALGAATEEIESEQTERVPEHLTNKHFPVNPEG